MTQKSLAYEFNDLNDKTEEELINMAKSGNEEAIGYLFNKYKDVINMKVNKYFIIGAEKEDIVQEAMIGLYKAIKNYMPDKLKNTRYYNYGKNKVYFEASKKIPLQAMGL